MEITDEFREKVDKAARSVAGQSQYDWEDVSQDMWVWFLENPVQYERYLELGDPFQYLKKVAKQAVYKSNNAYEHFSGNYMYTPPEVRGLLSEYLLDVDLASLSEHVDLVEGMLLLRESNPSYFKLIVDKWVHGLSPTHSANQTRAVDKLTVLMNRVNKAARYSYEGVGVRKVVSNGTATAWTDLERGQSTSSKSDRDWMRV